MQDRSSLLRADLVKLPSGESRVKSSIASIYFAYSCALIYSPQALMSDSTAIDLTQAISARVKTEREARNWSLSELAERSGVSKAMISKIERGEASPTATVLGRLSGAFGLT